MPCHNNYGYNLQKNLVQRILQFQTITVQLLCAIDTKLFNLDTDHSTAHFLLCANLGYINNIIIIIIVMQ